jgi:hypothetical protein
VGITNIKRVGGWMRCPHPCSPAGDDRRSFAYLEQADGTVMIASQKPAYSSEDCLRTLGLTWADLFPERDSRELGYWSQGGTKDRIVRGYEYCDPSGAPVGRVSRTENKTAFPQGHYKGGEYKPGLNGRPLPLYLAPLVRQAVAEGRTIYVTEGEKDALALWRAGLAATTKPGGASSAWLEPHVELLRDAVIIVVADRDEAGEKAARAAYAALRATAKSVRIVEAAEGKDAFDHLEAGLTVEQFRVRPDLLGAVAAPRGLDHFEEEGAEFLWEPYLRSRQINLLDAKGGSGKTTFALALAALGANGNIPWLGDRPRFRTLFFAQEDSPGEMRTVFREVGGRDASAVIPYTDPLELDRDGLMRVEELIRATGAGLVVFDAITYYLPGRIKAAFDNLAIAQVLNALREVMRRTGAAALNIRHFKQGRQGLGIEDWGTGGEVWRNSHRSQLVLLPHLERPRSSAIFHTKGSLVAGMGEPFGFSFVDGIFGWVKPSDLRIEDYVEDGKVPGKRAPAQGRPMEESSVRLREWLCEHVPLQWTSSREIEERARVAGFSVPGGAWTRAKQLLCTSRKSVQGWEMRLRSEHAQHVMEVDPFEDP